MRFDVASGACIDLVHTVLPDQFVERWDDLYWTPLRARFGPPTERPAARL
jgi:hypothetical protein